MSIAGRDIFRCHIFTEDSELEYVSLCLSNPGSNISIYYCGHGILINYPHLMLDNTLINILKILHVIYYSNCIFLLYELYIYIDKSVYDIPFKIAFEISFNRTI